jgi:prevent-host-death family protein
LATVETIGLRELNQNPSKAVARVRAGQSIIVTDRGKPILRMVPEPSGKRTLLEELVAQGRAEPPSERGMPAVEPELTPTTPSLSDLIIADRDRDRGRERKR